MKRGWQCAKDLLDQQIIDTSGRKVVRVNDVDLTEQRTNGNVEMRVTQVDVGLPGAVRRLLQGVVSPGMIRRHAGQDCRRALIRWEFVNLIESDPLRRVKLRITSRKTGQAASRRSRRNHGGTVAGRAAGRLSLRSTKKPPRKLSPNWTSD